MRMGMHKCIFVYVFVYVFNEQIKLSLHRIGLRNRELLRSSMVVMDAHRKLFAIAGHCIE